MAIATNTIILSTWVMFVLLLANSSCVSSDAVGRIVGGEDAVEQRYPYFAGLLVRNTVFDGDTRFVEPGDLFQCGASLIWEDVVLTAAHCISRFLCEDEEDEYTLDNINVTAVVNMSSLFSMDHSHLRQATVLRRHPDYAEVINYAGPDSGEAIYDHSHDILLLGLDQPVLDVEPVRWNRDSASPKNGNIVTVMGLGDEKDWLMSDDRVWGDDLTSTSLRASKLQEASLYSRNESFCRDQYRRDHYEFSETTMLCASVDGGGKGSCYGDSGGPLIVKGLDRMDDVQVGIVSFGNGCGSDAFPGAYTRLSAYDSFISDGLCELSQRPPEWCSRGRQLKARRRRPTVTSRRQLGLLDLNPNSLNCSTIWPSSGDDEESDSSTSASPTAATHEESTDFPTEAPVPFSEYLLSPSRRPVSVSYSESSESSSISTSLQISSVVLSFVLGTAVQF